MFEQQQENGVGSEFGTTGASPIARARLATRCDIDWRVVELDYVAARLSLREMAKKHGCSHSAIANRAGRHGWVRCKVAAEDVLPWLKVTATNLGVVLTNQAERQFVCAAGVA